MCVRGGGGAGGGVSVCVCVCGGGGGVFSQKRSSYIICCKDEIASATILYSHRSYICSLK